MSINQMLVDVGCNSGKRLPNLVSICCFVEEEEKLERAAKIEELSTQRNQTDVKHTHRKYTPV